MGNCEQATALYSGGRAVKRTLVCIMFALVVALSSGCVKEHVTVRHMVERTDFETYIFASDPPWAGQRDITDLPDILSRPHRLFIISYLAGDGRHLILAQSHTHNEILGKVLADRDPTKVQLAYTSPTGVKVWTTSPDNQMSSKLLRSSRHIIGISKRSISKQCVGWWIETPVGTFPFLAINGPVSEEELHAIIDSLVSAKEYVDE